MNSKSRLLQIVFVWVAMYGIAACSEEPAHPNDFSCDNTRQVAVWRAHIYENFSAGARMADARDVRNPNPTLRQMRDLHLQLRDYFQSEPMPDCMRGAIRIYVDGTHALKDTDSDQDILAAMQRMGATIDRFSEAVAKAKPEWAHSEP